MNWAEFVQACADALRLMGWAFSPLLLLPFFLLLFPKPALLRFSNALILTIDRLNFGLGEFIKWALPLLVFSVAFSVFALSIFGLSWTKLSESTIYLHAAIIMVGSAATLMAGQHVRVDIFYSQMCSEKRALVDFCGFYVLLLPVCVIILWNSQSFVMLAWQNLEGSTEADGIRGQFLLKSLISIFSLTLIAQSLAIALRAALMLRGQTLPAREPYTPPFFQKQKIEH